MQLPLTKQQEGLWFDYKVNPNSNSYNTALQIHFKSGLDLERFKKSVNIAINFFPSNRTKFSETNSEGIKQSISSSCEIDYLEFEDIRHDKKQSSYDLALERAREKWQKPFNLESDIPFRAHLVKYSDQGYVFTASIHHIIIDGISGLILCDSIILAYNSYDGNINNVVEILKQKFNQADVGDYLAEYNKAEYAHKIDVAKNYWQERLKNSNLILDIHGRNINFDMKEIRFSLGKERYELIKKYAKSYKTTSFIVISTLYAILLYRYFGQKDITMGYPANIRPDNLKDIFGFYVSVFPFRVQINGQETFDELVNKVTFEQKQDRDHLCLSMDQIIGLINNSNSSEAKDFNVYVGQTVFTCHPSSKMNGVETDIRIFQGVTKNDLDFFYDPKTGEHCQVLAPSRGEEGTESAARGQSVEGGVCNG